MTSFNGKHLEEKILRLTRMKIGDTCFMNGTFEIIKNKIKYAKRHMADGANFKTEAREGGRLITRIS